MTKPQAKAHIDGLSDKDLVEVKLAHPLGDRDKQRLGIPLNADTNVNDVVHVRGDDATALINAGYAQVDPEDVSAVAEALGQTPPVSVEPGTSAATGTDKSSK